LLISKTIIAFDQSINNFLNFVAPDFYDYFLGTRHLLDQDPTIWCVSAWNDNGKAGLIEPHENGKLYRSDFFPGLGWMMTKKLWRELGPKWPAGFWDDWMREPAQRNDRACIRPEISRTKTFGRIGVSQGQFFDQHLKFIVLNDKKFDFLHTDLSYLIKENYDKEFLSKIETLPVFSVDDIIARKNDNHKAVRVNYWTESTFNRVASRLGVMLDFKAGVPRAGYNGIVTAMYRGIRIYITQKK
jgi:alpha-1,3-mannosyl-glycoprotein beta-1,2-N-acetylglucosaminyltransferase